MGLNICWTTNFCWLYSWCCSLSSMLHNILLFNVTTHHSCYIGGSRFLMLLNFYPAVKWMRYIKSAVSLVVQTRILGLKDLSLQMPWSINFLRLIVYCFRLHACWNYLLFVYHLIPLQLFDGNLHACILFFAWLRQSLLLVYSWCYID